MIKRHRAYGLTIASEIPLSGPPADDREPDVIVRRAAVPAPLAGYFEIWPAERNAPRVEGVRAGAGYCIAYDRSSRFLVSATGREIDVDAAGCSPTALQHRLLAQVLPLALSLRDVVLHAGVAAAAGAACAFVGRAGTGKSTLTLACVQHGWTLVADDAVIVRQLSVTPSYPAVRVMRPGGGKQRVIRGLPFDGREVPLAAICVLDPEPAEEVRATRLTPRDAAVAVLGQMFRLEQRDPVHLERELSSASAMAAAVPMFRLAFPRDGQARAVVEEARRRVEAHGAMVSGS